MKRPKPSFGSILVSVITIVLSACATPSMRVPVTRPAEVNLLESKKIVVGEFKGRRGRLVENALTRELVNTGRFEVLDRSILGQKLRQNNPAMTANVSQVVADVLIIKLFESGNFRKEIDRRDLARILGDVNPSLSNTVDQNTLEQITKFVGAAYYLRGNVDFDYIQNDNIGERTKDSKGVIHRTYTKQGKAMATTTFQITSLTSGNIVALKMISRTSVRTTSADNRWPANPDREAIVDNVVYDTITTFMPIIVPYVEYVYVQFAPNDPKVPGLENGVNFAKAGMWPEAASEFKATVEKNPSHQGAWWDLGIAYEYNYQFTEAEHAFMQANRLQPCEKCLREINNVHRLDAERRKLIEQGAL
jgi:curli biogenesis system outer membrane secretion channel CsgG